MSGDLTQALRTAHSGLFTSQQALDAVARNVANVNTPGYSRKIVNLEQRTLAGAGAGVDFGVLSRRIDQGLLGSLRQETGGLHASDIRRDMLDRIETLFGTPESDSSLSHVLTDFQTAVESLAAAPQDGLGQREVVRRAPTRRACCDVTAAAFRICAPRATSGSARPSRRSTACWPRSPT